MTLNINPSDGMNIAVNSLGSAIPALLAMLGVLYLVWLGMKYKLIK